MPDDSSLPQHASPQKCPVKHCRKWCLSSRGLQSHVTKVHAGVELTICHESEDSDEDPSTLFEATSSPRPPINASSSPRQFHGLHFHQPQDTDFDIDMDFVSGGLDFDNVPGSCDSETDSEWEITECQDGNLKRKYHPYLDARTCDQDGTFVLPGETPPRWDNVHEHEGWYPFKDRRQFEAAEFLFTENQMSAGDIDTFMRILAMESEEGSEDGSTRRHSNEAPFNTHDELYKLIDAIPYGGVKWESYDLTYNGPVPDPHNRPPWADKTYKIWFRNPLEVVKNLLANRDFKNEFEYRPYQEYLETDGNSDHIFHHLMSGDWAWRQATEIGKDESTHGSMLVPIILGSDKTCVSVATGDNEYWPLYLSIGNIHNNTRRGRRNGVVLIGFLVNPKTDHQHKDTNSFRKFFRQLFHTSLSYILRPLYDAMTKPVVVKCADGFFRKAVIEIGPYIADYPEQCLVTSTVQNWCPRCITLLNANQPPTSMDDAITPRTLQHTTFLVTNLELGTAWAEYGIVGDVIPFTEDFPRADIYNLIAPDILHQVIKGAFKDHLLTWILAYLDLTLTPAEAKAARDEIDYRISLAPLFLALRHFPEGRNYKQWTGNDSKALMKVILPALHGYVLPEMIQALRALIEICYVMRRESIDTTSLEQLRDALGRFFTYIRIFSTVGIRDAKMTPPRQHALRHILYLIRMFGAPNGLCSSITESKHIKAVKEPYRRSNKNQALGQMLKTNERLDKLAAARVHFEQIGLLPPKAKKTGTGERQKSNGTAVNADQEDDDGDEAIIDGPLVCPPASLAKTVIMKDVNFSALTALHELYIDLPQLLESYILDHCGYEVTREECLELTFRTFNSMVVSFYAPSDICGSNGMKKERIRAVESWRGGLGRYDTIFIRESASATTIRTGLQLARARLFFSFVYDGTEHQCCVVQDYSYIGQEADAETGMWMVEPTWVETGNGSRCLSTRVIPIRQVLRASHLLPYFGNGKAPPGLSPEDALDNFQKFYVNRYIDHHAFEVAF